MAPRSHRHLRLLVATAVALAALGLAGATSSRVGASGTADLLDVVQVGDGSAPLTNAATASFIVPLLGTGTTGTPLPLPTAAAGAQRAFGISGSATSEGALELSADGNYLTLAGYGAPPGTTGPTGGTINGTTSANVPRVVARVDGAGHVDTSTALSDAFSASNVRGAVTNDGAEFWVTGDGGSTSGGTVANASIAYADHLGATTSTGLTTSPKQSRVPVIAAGKLYMSTSKSPGPGVFQVGTGLPTTSGRTVSSVAAEADPYSFVLLAVGGATPDTLYVADGTVGGIFKYALSGSAWVAKGSVPGPALGGLTGRVEGSGVQLYATTNAGDSVLAFTDSSGAGNAISTGSTLTTIASAPINTVYRGIAFAPAGQVPPPPPTPAPTVTLSDTALGATIGDPANPTLTATVGDDAFGADQLSVAATSSNAAVVPSANIAVSGSGATRTLTLTPTGVGTSTITVTATTPDGVSGTAHLFYGASEPAPDATSAYLYGAADASTAIDVGDGYIVVADDEDPTLRLYRTGGSGFPVKTWTFASQVGNPGELDLEWSAREGSTLVWGGSESNSKDGSSRPSASVVFATTLTGFGASTDLSFAGFYTGLRNDLIAWDAANGNTLGLAASGADGVDPKQAGGYNIEGMEFAPDGSGTAYLGFRAPQEPASNRQLALVVPVTNLLGLLSGSASRAAFGSPFAWDLGGLGVREIRRNADAQYLVIAGGPGEQTAAMALYTWDGIPAHPPVRTNTALPAPPEIDGAWESIVSVPDPLTDGAPVTLIEDNGDTVWYGGTTVGKDLPAGLEKDWLDTFAISLPSQSIEYTSTPPASPFVGTTYVVSASGGPSGNPVVFAIDPASAPGACSLAGATVSFTGAGACIVDADQGGSFQYAAAQRVSQTIAVVTPPAPVITPVIAGTLGNAGWYVSNVTVSWSIASPVSASSCNPTTLTADTGGTTVSCTSTSTGGTTTQSVTIKIDQTKPTVTFTGNAGSYTVAQSVSIACTASDPAPGSGLATSTCPSVNAPAWTFGLGAQTLTANAADVAGNARSASTSFTVTVTAAALCTLTDRFVQGSANYQRLSPLGQKIVDLLTTGTCQFLTQLAPKLKPAQKTALITAYKQAAQSLASSGWLTRAQANTLGTFAEGL